MTYKIKYITSYMTTDNKDYTMKIKTEKTLITASYKGDLVLAKQLLLDNPYINIFGKEGLTLSIVCKYKYYDFAEWLLSLNPENIIVNYVFVDLCYYGHLESAKWLLSKRPNIDVTIKNNNAFIWACEQSLYAWSINYLDIAKWLLSLKPYHYILEFDKFGALKKYSIRKPNDVKWLERRIPLLAYNTNTDNDFKKLNFDVIREICLFI
jgi:hypothetical protein